MSEGRLSLFFKELETGRLTGSKCKSCGAVFTPPRPLCSRCGGETEIINLKGEGTIESFTVIHVPPTLLKDACPYILALVKLKEGALIMGRLLGYDPNKPEEIKIGSKVRFEAVREKHGEKEETIVAFKPL
ncbi:TPA: Zn-ribbon domain-containing OB-fold protein [Candidatus Bathyarchaeota archaeon]|nr:Zn-ribbon domain-containing OB-fold protein [Candidatus Bathyarchaeota archaeon]